MLKYLGKGAKHQTPMCPEGVGIEAHAPGQHFWRSVATGARVQAIMKESSTI